MRTLSTYQSITEKQQLGTRCETKLIVCCARTQIDELTSEKIKALLQQDIDWKYVIQSATYHKVMPLLYQNLNTVCPKLVPQNVLAYLQQSFQKNAARNLFLTMELLRILNIFECQGITAIPIKGAILASSVYGNLALRRFCDLDILVRQKDAIKARDILVSEGYESSYNFTREQEVARLKSPYCKDNNYFHKDSRINIDFHWQLLQRYLSFPLDHERLWERHTFASIAGKKVIHLSAEDNLLFLCVHGSRDRWRNLSLICDIAELIRIYPNINWRQVIEQARILGCNRRLLLGLFLANNLLGTDLPEEILQKIAEEVEIKFLAIKVYQEMFQHSYETPSLIERSLFDIRIREYLQDKIKYCVYQSVLTFTRSNGILTTLI